MLGDRGNAVAAAVALRDELGVEGLAGDEDADRAVARFGLWVEPFRQLPGLRAGYLLNRVIWVADHLRGGSRRYVIAHELGHRALGHGNAMFPPQEMGVYDGRRETEADLFAGSFLLGPPGLAQQDVLDQADGSVGREYLIRYFNAAWPIYQALANFGRTVRSLFAFAPLMMLLVDANHDRIPDLAEGLFRVTGLVG